MNTKHVMIHDENLCIGCQACTAACNNANQLPDGQYRLEIHQRGPFEVNGELHYQYLRVSCEQCDNAACLQACPYGAIKQSSEGIISINSALCHACLSCVAACPFGGAYYNGKIGSTDKCDFCMTSRVEQGLSPACVEVCPTDALIFGDTNDPNSEVNQKLSTNSSYQLQCGYNNKPKLYRVACQSLQKNKS
ncbi:4Fe-4S dicluster domain-containing protein [Shewanella youngdeokensis]|uniref:4Fe-4S dicluster domain-containing protein n=1 Tax=Shewanella youngdeokensis TaxID=2999068 RepID=A0ABZ0JW72_9GAMM|nr:4Fe-4S dicluster domain-containing protein [Shewanella sp. DAU334]